jgi:putative aldouronate transport system substrate-binding protein
VKANEKDITPLAANGGYLWNFQDSFDISPVEGRTRQLGGNCTAYESNPTKAVHDYLDPMALERAKKSMLIARDWYLKGYVRSDLLAISDIIQEEKAGKFAAGFQTYKPGSDISFEEANGYKVYTFPLSKPQLSGVSATELAISATSKNPERTMMFIELLNNDPELDNLIVYGIEDRHYVKTGKNSISSIKNNGYQPNLGWMYGNTFNQYILTNQPENLHEQIEKGNNEARSQFMGDWTFDNERVRNEDAAVSAIWLELGNPLWAGVLDVEKNLKIFIEKIKKAGTEKIHVEVQRQLDEYLRNR